MRTGALLLEHRPRLAARAFAQLGRHRLAVLEGEGLRKSDLVVELRPVGDDVHLAAHLEALALPQRALGERAVALREDRLLRPGRHLHAADELQVDARRVVGLRAARLARPLRRRAAPRRRLPSHPGDGPFLVAVHRQLAHQQRRLV